MPSIDAAGEFIRLTRGVWMGQAISTAARLGIADILADGEKNIVAIAEECDAHIPSLYRLLRALASIGFFNECELRTFALTPLAEYLRSDVDDSMKGLALGPCQQWIWRSFERLYDTVMDGAPGISKSFDYQQYHDYLSSNPQDKNAYDATMSQLNKMTLLDSVGNYDFSHVKTVVDIAGGNGSLLSFVLERNSNLRGVLYDLPQTKANTIGKNASERWSFVEGNMFESIPQGGDIYIICNVASDWSDRDYQKIISNVREVMRPETKLLCIEFLIPDGNEYHYAKWLDLFELVAGSGSVKTKERFIAMVEEVGLIYKGSSGKNQFSELLEFGLAV